MNEMLSMEHWWEYRDEGQLRYCEKNPSQCQSVRASNIPWASEMRGRQGLYKLRGSWCYSVFVKVRAPDRNVGLR